MVNLTIDGKKYQAEEGQNVLEVALENGIEIPHLCYHENLSPYGGCRLCLVEVTRNGRAFLTTSCTYPCLDGIIVKTDTPEVLRARRLVLELLMPLAPEAPQLQALARQMEIEEPRFKTDEEADDCIRCGLCVRACTELVGAQAITFSGRGYRKTVEPPFGEEALDCIGCGTCVFLCPTGCIQMVDKSAERTIARWQRTLPLKACSSCGRYYIPFAQIEFARQKSREAPAEDWFDLCPDCR
ncbi:MAG: 2Fe-2S iron-sulfur cluster binding domain-containing protein [Firmicutes bacterium]|jgi:bidirectional [NiFe] hydrogenase diaphorase subunit|nr:2Fe-2S iron-sulfur cluster binding domain-containing protein [Bacillota bacterium]